MHRKDTTVSSSVGTRSRSTAQDLVAPKDLALRWSCSRSTVDRIARRAGFSRVLLGSGKNGLLRYRFTEVEAYEQECTITVATN